MKYGWLRRTLILALAAALCFGMTRFSRQEEPQETPLRLSVWYVGSDYPAAAMEALLERCRRETGVRFTVTAYANEQALGAAFESGRPDLLFCSHLRAGQLDARESLGRLPEPLPVPETLAAFRPGLGASFFPIGSRLPVLLTDTARTGADYASLEALLDAAGDQPFLACGCAAELLYTSLVSAGVQMSGIPAQDAESGAYAALYNRVALAVFRGGLVVCDRAADYVRQGLLPCAVVLSTELAGLRNGTLEARALPLPEGGRAIRPAELMGFALLDGADAQAADSFARWLWSGESAEAAFTAGLVPFSSGATARSDYARLLESIAASGTLNWPDADEPFYQNRDACERSVRAALDLLT